MGGNMQQSRPNTEATRMSNGVGRTTDSAWAVFLAFLRLGLTSFGGPVAHLGYFRDEFVTRRRWLSERAYADLVALCQFLPGPASSQVGIAIGLSRAGYAGALAAWLGFTLPSAVLMILIALGLASHADAIPSGALHGLKLAAVAVVAQAVWGMARHHCNDAPRATLMAAAACFVLMVPTAWAQLAVIATAAVLGRFFLTAPAATTQDQPATTMSRGAGLAWLTLFVTLLLGLPLLGELWSHPTLARIDAFFRTGSLVFGGGHVVLPLLQADVVSSGWVDADTFLAGYGAAQAMPGPLFTFAAFLGASMTQAPTAWLGGLLYLVAIFVPSFLLVFGALPFWESLRRNRRTQAALLGIDASVVGLLLAALHQPVWTSAVHTSRDFALALVALIALMFWKLPPWLVVAGCAAAGWLEAASR